MTAPGWYQDPDGTPQLRYFDGLRWTSNTAPIPTQPLGAPRPPTAPPWQGAQHGDQGFSGHGQAGIPQYPRPPSEPPPVAGRGPGGGNLWLWIAFGVVVLLIIGVATWLLFFRQAPTDPPAPTPPPSTTQPAGPTPEPTTPPPTEPTPEPTAQPPTEPSSPPAGPLLETGAVIEAVAGCPATASDAIGEQGADNRYVSGAGFSVAAAEGFSAAPVQYPWVHQSNSQVKTYGTDWMAAITVGTLRPEDGFTDTGSAAVAMVACMLGSDFYAGHATEATVEQSARAPDGDAVAMTVKVGVDGVDGVTSDLLYVMTVGQDATLHVVIATVPDSDAVGIEAVGDAVADVRLG